VDEAEDEPDTDGRHPWAAHGRDDLHEVARSAISSQLEIRIRPAIMGRVVARMSGAAGRDRGRARGEEAEATIPREPAAGEPEEHVARRARAEPDAMVRSERRSSQRSGIMRRQGRARPGRARWRAWGTGATAPCWTCRGRPSRAPREREGEGADDQDRREREESNAGDLTAGSVFAPEAPSISPNHGGTPRAGTLASLV